MGYVERKIATGLATSVAVIFGIAIVAVGPYVLGKHLGGNSLGWVFEGAYLILALALGVLLVRKVQRDAQERVQAQQQLAIHRQQMSRTNTPWFDPAVRAYRHSTCSIKHRSTGAAARCRQRF